MAHILKIITDTIRHNEQNNFANFNAETFPLAKRSAPLDVPGLIADTFFLIAEAKKGSPSKGIICEDFDPVALARAYEAGGASAVSVLTEQEFFFGKKEYLTAVKQAVSLPVLRKDFIVHAYQVYESYNLGADLVLLIAACLDDHTLRHLHALVRSLGMHALIEVHDAEEIARVLPLQPRLLGINNRDLKTFKVDLATSFELIKMIPEDVYVISESGIATHEDIVSAQKNGFAGALVGESLLRHPDAKSAVQEILYGTN